jgi:hypothetical protein
MVLEPRPSPIFFETLLDKERAGNTEPDAISFSFLKLADGLFVVVNMPPTAFVVRAGEVKPLPGFFAGLRSPSPDWPPEMFYVSSLSGTLDPLSFDIYAPATEYRDGVSGKPGRWKTRSGRRTGAKATQPAWVVPETISEPLTTQKGARLYEVAPEAFAPARVGFSFRFDGPARGEKLPVPAPGTNGCRFAVLGHPLLTQNADGSLMGLGTLCTSGDDEISTSKLDGIAPLFQWISPRLTHGQLAVERWVDGKSVVLPLPGAERVADFAPFDFVRVAKPGGESLYVASQVVGAKGNEGYLAEFDGAGFRNVTPPGPPELFKTFVSSTNDLYLLHQAGSYRRRGDAWQRIELQRSKDCGKDWMSSAVETSTGLLLLHGGVGCLWTLERDAVVASLVPLEEGHFIDEMLPHLGELYVVFSTPRGPELTRLRRR